MWEKYFVHVLIRLQVQHHKVVTDQHIFACNISIMHEWCNGCAYVHACMHARTHLAFKTLFQYTFRVAMCSLPVITVLLAASAEMDTVSQWVGSKWIQFQLHSEQGRVEIDTASIMSHYRAYCYTVHFNEIVTLFGVSQVAYTPPFNPLSAQWITSLP